jgi:ELWxxDGT repeat protein
VAIFSADDGTSGRELWRTDGTEAGTVRIKDIRPGIHGSNPTYITNAGGTSGTDLILFAADGVGTGVELWKTDGTAAGTVLVKDIRPGGPGSSPQNLTATPWGVLFSANDGSSGRELWKSDGTAAGTVLVKDLNPGTANSGPSQFTNGSAGGSPVVFFTADGGQGVELWKTDGTAAGTVLVDDINPGTTGSTPRHLAWVGTDVAGPFLAFSATDGTTGREFWKSDGTSAGTVLLKDLRPGTGSSNPADFAVTLVNNTGEVLFTANVPGFGRELWRTDGTAAGTILIKDIR